MKLKSTFTVRSARSRAKDERGLTLIEVMVTALIVALLAAAAATALIATAKASGHEQFRSEADSLVAQDQEQMRELSDDQLYALQNGASRTHPVQLGGITFTVASTAKFGSATNTAGCSASSASYYETASTVTWHENGQLQTVKEDSLLTRPVFGVMVVQVQDTAKNPLPGVSVSASTTTAAGQVEQQSAQTNATGCVLFAGLDAGNYTVNLVKAGYEDVNGKGQTTTNPSSYSVAVPSSGTSVSYTLGQASGPITATFTAAPSGTGEADGLSWKASGWTAPATSPATGGTTATWETSATGLYPQAYAVWAGRCAGQEPTTPTTVPLSPGQSPPTAVSEPAINLAVTYAASSNQTGTAAIPSDVVLTYADSTKCFDSWAATIAAPTSGGAAPSTGWLAHPGQPYAPSGTLTICADYKTNGTYYYGSTTRGNTSSGNVTVAIVGGTSPGRCAIRTS